MQSKIEHLDKLEFEGNEKIFWKKIKRILKFAGKGITEKVLVLYNMFVDPKVPKNVKLIVASGLSYFLLPFDSIPDFLVGIGFSDDLGVLLGITYMVASHITTEHKQKAREMTNSLFGE